MAITELTLASTFEQTMLAALQNVLLSKIDKDGRKVWPEDDKESQLEIMLDYANSKELHDYFSRKDKDQLPRLDEFLKQPQYAQFKALLPSYKGFSF